MQKTECSKSKHGKAPSRRKPKNVTGAVSSQSGAARQALPQIHIESIKSIEYSEMSLRMEDETFELIADIGMNCATPKDYFQIGFLHLLEDTLKRRRKRGARSSKS